MEANFYDLIDDEAIFPTEFFVKDVFKQLRKNSNGVLELDTEDDEMVASVNLNENRRCRPTLERTLSHETTLKRKKREHARRSLNEELLNAEWATYSPEEREILDFVVRKASLEENKSRKKSSKLQKLRINRPKIFARNRSSTKTTKATKPGIPVATEIFGEKQTSFDENSDGKVSSKKPWFIRRFIDSASQLKSPSSSPKSTSRRQMNEDGRRHNFAISDSPCSSRRRPAGNFQVHALLQKEVKRSSSLQCLSANSFSAVEEFRKTHAEASSKSQVRRRASDVQTKRERKEKVKLFRAGSARQQRDFEPEENDTFFEIFERFCKDPMALIDATEIDC